jgi:hypothetical protein
MPHASSSCSGYDVWMSVHMYDYGASISWHRDIAKNSSDNFQHARNAINVNISE